MFNNNDIKRGMINTIEKKTIKKNININSLFRELELINSCNNYKQCGKTELVTLDYTESKWNSSNFFIWLPTPLENVINMTLRSLELPHTFYTFSSELKTNVFTIVELRDAFDSSNCCIYTPIFNEQTSSTCSTTSCDECDDSEEFDSSIEYPCRITHVIEIIPGNYSSEELVAQIQASIDATLGPNIVKINMNPNYGRTYIYAENNDSSTEFKFDLDFRIPDDPMRNIQMNMGWILGYRKPYYHYDDTTINGCGYGPDYIENDATESINNPGHDVLGPVQSDSCFVKQNYNDSTKCNQSIIAVPNTNYPGTPSYPYYPQGFVSEGFMDTSGARYLFLIVDDFNNNVNDQYMSLVTKNTQLPSSNILARIIIPHSKHTSGFENLANFIPNKRNYFGPVNIEKLHFKLLDEFGRIINLNNNDISLLLEFEVLYNL